MVDAPSMAVAKAREAATMRAAEARPSGEVPADYLLAHQEYAPGMAFQGLGPALRTVPPRRASKRRSNAKPTMRNACRMAPWAMRRAGAGSLFVTALLVAPLASAQDAIQWLTRVSNAARTLNYTGTIVNQYGGRIETSRIVHLSDNGQEWEKLTSLDGPAREVVRSSGEVRCYFPDEKVVRVEARTLRNVFAVAVAGADPQPVAVLRLPTRVGRTHRRHAAEIVAFEPKDGLRYGHKFGPTRAPDCC